MQGINGSIAGTLDSNYYKGSGERQNVEREVVYMEKEETAVRRLTPLECERLQGFPDGWTDIGEWTDSKGKKHKEADSPRYKALGTLSRFRFGFGFFAASLHSMNVPQRSEAFSMGLVAFRFAGSDATEKVLQYGRAR